MRNGVHLDIAFRFLDAPSRCELDVHLDVFVAKMPNYSLNVAKMPNRSLDVAKVPNPSPELKSAAVFRVNGGGSRNGTERFHAHAGEPHESAGGARRAAREEAAASTCLELAEGRA